SFLLRFGSFTSLRTAVPPLYFRSPSSGLVVREPEPVSRNPGLAAGLHVASPAVTQAAIRTAKRKKRLARVLIGPPSEFSRFPEQQGRSWSDARSGCWL